MSATLQRLANEATEIYGRMKAITDEHGDALPAEKAAEWDKLNEAFDAKTGELEHAKKVSERKARADALMADLDRPANRLNPPAGDGKADAAEAETRQYKAWAKAIAQGPGSLSEAERKDLSASTDAQGGFLTAPAQTVQAFIKFIDDEVYLRQLATVWPLDVGVELTAPSWETDPADADWTTEIQAVSFDTAARTGQRSLKPHLMTKGMKVSRRLLNQSRVNAEQLVRDRLAYKVAITEEKAFMVGDGFNKALGIFTASPQGIPTTRNVTASSATGFTADNILDTKHNLKAAYWGRPSTRWILHRTIIAALRKQKDGNGNYIWSPGLGPGGGITNGLPATIVDVPYIVSEYAPNTLTTAQPVAVIGDMSNYWIADSQRIEIQILFEKYAETNQVGYIVRAECDGMPVLAEAFSRLVLA